MITNVKIYGICCAKEENSQPGSFGQIPTVPIDPATGLPEANFPWWEYFTYKPSQPETTTPTTTTTTTTTTQRPAICGPSGVPSVPIDPATGLPEANFPWWQCFPFNPATTTTTTSAPPPLEVAPVVAAQQGVIACGVGPKKILSLDEQSRIVGGTDAVRNSWPFQVH